MKKIKININKFSCPEDEKTIIKRYEKEIINDEGERENILVCDVFLDPLKGVRYDGTNKDDAMLALLGADSLEEMKEIANGDKTMMEVVHAFEDMLNDEEFINEYKGNVKENAYKDGYDEGFDDGCWAEKVIISRRLLNKDFDYGFIGDITNLSIEEVKRIESELN